MITLAMARTDLLPPEALESLRAALPPDRRTRADRYHRERDRRASVVAFALLQHLWSAHSPDPMPPVVPGPFGKPAFADASAPHFNLSHDAAVCACAFATAPVGVDVQSRVPFDDALFERMAAPAERRLRARLRRTDDLSPLWTRKEALVKRSGRGLATPLAAVDTTADPDLRTFACPGLDLHISLTAPAPLRITWPRLTAHPRPPAPVLTPSR
jgi:phosphopantetheinyl transferase